MKKKKESCPKFHYSMMNCEHSGINGCDIDYDKEYTCSYEEYGKSMARSYSNSQWDV